MQVGVIFSVNGEKPVLVGGFFGKRLKGCHERWNNLLLTAYDAWKNSNVAVNLYVKGALDDVGSICAVEEHLGDLALNVGEHVEDHWKLFGLSSSLQERSNKFLCSFAAGLGHE